MIKIGATTSDGMDGCIGITKWVREDKTMLSCLKRMRRLETSSWRRGVAVTRCVRSMKVLYARPAVSTWMGG